MKLKYALCASFCTALLSTACTSRPPLSDQMMLVSAPGKAGNTSGLDLAYLYGTNQGALTHVSCDQSKNCWFSGILGTFKTNRNRINSLVIHTVGISDIAWANTYQINDIYTSANGLVPTPDGGAMLYGNTIVARNSGKHAEPTYEKLDAAGRPQWGGSLFIGGFKPWSAFSDTIRLQNGDYLLAGSGYIEKDYSYGVLVKIDASGKMIWSKIVRSRKDPTIISNIAQLGNGDIMAVGINAELRDIVFFRVSPDGRPLDSAILDIRGYEAPIGLVPLPDGVAVAVTQQMPSGEVAGIVLDLDKNGKLQDAARFHYVDGFSPNSIVPLGTGKICLYGTTTARDKPESIALVLDEKLHPASALTMKGDSVFNSAALYNPGTIVFAGNRNLGTDERMTPLVTRWSPELKNDPKVLKNIRRDGLNMTLRAHARATVSPWKLFKMNPLQPTELPFRSIYQMPTGSTAQ